MGCLNQISSLVGRIFMLLFGLTFTVVGAFLAIFAAGEARAAVERAERLQPALAAQIERGGLGSEFLIEGTVSPLNQLRFRDFVAYTQEEYRGTDDDGDPEWRVVEQVAPPLLLESGGPVRVAEGYSILGQHERWQDSEQLRWNGLSGAGTMRYTGLVAGRPATTIGVTQRGGAGVELRVEFVYAGTRAEYIQYQRNTATFLPWFGGLFAVVGLLMAGFGLLGLLRGR